LNGIGAGINISSEQNYSITGNVLENWNPPSGTAGIELVLDARVRFSLEIPPGNYGSANAVINFCAAGPP
jgi:hypothetical protein